MYIICNAIKIAAEFFLSFHNLFIINILLNSFSILMGNPFFLELKYFKDKSTLS